MQAHLISRLAPAVSLSGGRRTRKECPRMSPRQRLTLSAIAVLGALVTGTALTANISAQAPMDIPVVSYAPIYPATVGASTPIYTSSVANPQTVASAIASQQFSFYGTIPVVSVSSAV